MSEDAVGIEIPDEHVGPFVAEVFEDAERSTTWTEVVDAMVAPDAREDWSALSPAEQAAEVLGRADSYDRQAIDALADVETDGSADPAAVETQFAEARRCRTNADAFRDGVATAYGEGYLDDDALLKAIERVGFDTDTIARREEELERVANHFELDYQPYGGTLIQEEEREPQAGTETW